MGNPSSNSSTSRNRNRPNEARAAAAWLGTIALALLSLAVLSLGSDAPLGTPSEALAEHALGWQPPGASKAEEQVARMAAELTPWGQLDYSVRARPLLRYQDLPGDAKPGELIGRFTISGRVDFADPPATHARARQALERADRSRFRLQLDGIRDALLAHAYLLLAQEEEARRRDELVAADEALSRATRDSAETDTRELRVLTLEQRGAELAHRRAGQELSEARAAARPYGFVEPVLYRPLRFSLPSGREVSGLSHRLHEHRMLQLALREAEGELSEALAGPLDDLRLRGAYRGRAAEIDLEAGIVNGRPGATFGLTAPGGPERWQLEFSAELVLDDGWAKLPLLEQAVADAGSDLKAFSERHRAAVAGAVARAEITEEALGLAEEEVELAEELLAERLLLLSELATSGGQEPAGAGTEERAWNRAEREVARAARAASGARTRLYRAWIAYVRAAAEVLLLTDGSWEALGR